MGYNLQKLWESFYNTLRNRWIWILKYEIKERMSLSYKLKETLKETSLTPHVLAGGFLLPAITTLLFLLLNNVPLYKYAIYQLMDIWIVFTFSYVNHFQVFINKTDACISDRIKQIIGAYLSETHTHKMEF